LPIAIRVNVPPANLERFLPADRLRHLLQAYPDYRSAFRWGVFLPHTYVFTVAGPERDDIIRLLPGANDVPEGSIWDLDNPDFRVVRARNNLTTLREIRQWHAETPGHPWLGRILVVHHPATVAIQSADLLRVNVGDILTLLGQPFWMWHTTDLLEGSYVVPATSATTYIADTSAEETEGSFPFLGLVQVSRLLPPVFLDPDTLD